MKASPEERVIWKVGCADAVPITQKPVLRRSGELYAVRSGPYWFQEGGTGDRPLLSSYNLLCLFKRALSICWCIGQVIPHLKTE